MIKKIILIGALAIAGLTLAHFQHNYTMDGVVKNENTIVDATGKAWEIDDLQYRDGAEIKISFFDNMTADRADDVVSKIVLK